MKIPFEYCALRFLLQWEQRERKLHECMQTTPSVEELKKSLSHFQVARSFKDISVDSKARYVLSELSKIGRKNGSPEDKVVELSDKFHQEFGKCNVSAASKLLWLKFKAPFIIYDARAAKALKSNQFECKFKERDYQEYCQQWRAKYAVNEKFLQVAAKRLIDIHDFFPAWHKSKKELSNLVTERWFLERVFDIYLWELGGER